ncbi:hypothetical protein Hanom_Chr16g01513751 [Helianthus anomalus]
MLTYSIGVRAFTLSSLFLRYQGEEHKGGFDSFWMEHEVLLIILLSCFRVGGGRVSAHLGESIGWRQSSSRPC